MVRLYLTLPWVEGSNIYVLAWANCVAYLGRWAMREPDERDKQEQLPTLFCYIGWDKRRF